MYVELHTHSSSTQCEHPPCNCTLNAQMTTYFYCHALTLDPKHPHLYSTISPDAAAADRAFLMFYLIRKIP